MRLFSSLSSTHGPSISNTNLPALPDVCVPEPLPLPWPLFCLLLGAEVSVLDANESLIPLLSDARPESLDGLLIEPAKDVTVVEVAVTVDVDRPPLEVDTGGVGVVFVVNFLLSSLNCSCCFEEKEQ